MRFAVPRSDHCGSAIDNQFLAVDVARVIQQYAGSGTTAAALSWRNRTYTVLLTGTSGITAAQLQAIANHLTITSS